MQESLDEYARKVEYYTNEELKSILFSIDKEKNRDRYDLVSAQIESRKAAGTWEASPAIDEKAKYRTLKRRFAAILLDGLLFLLITLVLLRPFALMDHLGGSEEELRQRVLPFYIKQSLIGIAYMTYSILMHWRFGATLGKMALGVAVVDFRTEGRIKLWQAALRDAVPAFVIVVNLLLVAITGDMNTRMAGWADQINSAWSLLEILTALFNSRRRALHDWMARTVCIRR